MQRPRAHQHRTLHFNASGTPQNPSSDADSADASTPRWVARNDRHRQLINADVYEKDAQSRAKAVEETRRRKQTGQRRGERAQFKAFLTSGQAGATVSSNADGAAVPNEITIDGIRFRVLAGGKKLAKIAGAYLTNSVSNDFSILIISCVPDGLNELASTPKFAVVAGVKFHRTRTGNLVPNRVVQDHRYVSLLPEAHLLTMSSRSGRVKKIGEPCQIFSTTGIYLLYSLYPRSATMAVTSGRYQQPLHRVLMGMYGQF